MNNIPDLTELTTKILEFIEFYDEPSTQDLIKNNKPNYNYIISERFIIIPFAMIKLLSDNENRAQNLEKIMDMIAMLEKVKNGSNTFQNAEEVFFEKRASEYLYPQFGGREKFYKVAEENKLKQEQDKTSGKTTANVLNKSKFQ
jgi:hypothetical protein